MTLEQADTTASLIETGLTILAILGGWYVGYRSFYRNRFDRPRLTLKAQARATSPTEILIDVELSNLGSPKVDLAESGRGVKFWYAVPADNSAGVDWEDPRRVVRLFTNHSWIEARESVTEQIYIPEVDARRTIRVEARIVAVNLRSPVLRLPISNIEVSTVAIATPFHERRGEVSPHGQEAGAN